MESNAVAQVKSDIERVDEALNTFIVAGKEYPMPKIKARRAINYMRRAAQLGKETISESERLEHFADLLEDFIDDSQIPELDDLPLGDVMKAFNNFFGRFAKSMGQETQEAKVEKTKAPASP